MPAAEAARHGFVLLPRFSLQALGGAVDALAAANAVLQRLAYVPLMLSLDGRPVRSGAGAAIAPELPLAQAPTLDALYVVAEAPLPEGATLAPLIAALQELAAHDRWLAGLGSGALVLARAGVLDGFRATLPGADVPQAAAEHAAVVFSHHVYEIDGRRLSCAGAGASLDLMLAWLGLQHGERVLGELVAHFGLERLRARDERQRSSSAAARAGAGSAKLAEALALMEANLGEPLPTDDIARLVGVSRRQLERLFKQHMDELPSRWYAELRLKRAQRLLQQTPQSILQIALACGFASGSHFSNAYRARFGRTPRDERSQRAAAWRGTSSNDGDDDLHEAQSSRAPRPTAPAPDEERSTP